jgi:hypothetical protein
MQWTMERAPLIARGDREAPERHRDADRVEVEFHPCAHKERARNLETSFHRIFLNMF